MSGSDGDVDGDVDEHDDDDDGGGDADEDSRTRTMMRRDYSGHLGCHPLPPVGLGGALVRLLVAVGPAAQVYEAVAHHRLPLEVVPRWHDGVVLVLLCENWLGENSAIRHRYPRHGWQISQRDRGIVRVGLGPSFVGEWMVVPYRRRRA